MVDLSIVIVNYNSYEWLLACVESVIEQTESISYEIIVVDNASHDGTLHDLPSHYPDVTLIANETNVGFPAANNQGFAVSQGRYLLMLNPDTLIHENALMSLVEVADTLSVSSGIFGARTLAEDGTLDLTCRPFPTVLNVAYAHFQVQRLLPGILDHRYLDRCRRASQPFPVDWVQGCCLMFRRELLAEIGDLDPQFFLFTEEVDFCYRARQAGYQAYYIPQAEITHFGSKSTIQNVPHKIRSHHVSKLRFFRKHRSAGALLTLRLVFLLEMGIKALFRLVQHLLSRADEPAIYLRAYLQTMRDCLYFES